MKKKQSLGIIPQGPTEDDEFDELAFPVADRQRRKGKKKSLSKSKLLRDTRIVDDSLTTKRTASFDWRKYVRIFVLYLETFFLDSRSRRLAAPFLFLGLLLCGILEVMQAHFRYNITILLVLSGAALYPNFPRDSVRPQLCISTLTLYTFIMDIYKLSTKFSTRDNIITLVFFVMLCKIFVFNAFLRNSTAAPRTRKYLDRRIRLFFIPLKQPKRIMRDIRGRFLALGWIHLFSIIAYLLYLLIFLYYFDYSILLLTEQSGKMLPIYLFIKIITTLFIFLGILYDTDIILTLWYFGCFGFHIDYVRQYIVKKRIELKGWPLAFAYYGLRFYILSFVKLIDVCWGIYGWYLIGSNFIDGFLRIEDSLKIYLTFLMYTMAITDIWCPILFLSIRWLLKRQKMKKELKLLEISDDSEIDEFQLREELEPTIQENERKLQKRQQHFQKYIDKGFEGEPGNLTGDQSMDLKSNVKANTTRKPSKANKVKTKGKKKMKDNMIMPYNEQSHSQYPVDPELGGTYGYDEEGQIIIDPLIQRNNYYDDHSSDSSDSDEKDDDDDDGNNNNDHYDEMEAVMNDPKDRERKSSQLKYNKDHAVNPLMQASKLPPPLPLPSRKPPVPSQSVPLDGKDDYSEDDEYPDEMDPDEEEEIFGQVCYLLYYIVVYRYLTVTLSLSLFLSLSLSLSLFIE